MELTKTRFQVNTVVSSSQERILHPREIFASDLVDIR